VKITLYFFVPVVFKCSFTKITLADGHVLLLWQPGFGARGT